MRVSSGQKSRGTHRIAAGGLASIAVLAGALYAGGIIGPQTEKNTEKTSSFKAAVLEKVPTPLPTPTFHFADNDAAESDQLTLAAHSSMPNSGNAFSPNAIAELLQTRTGEPTPMDTILQSVENAEAELPPISNTLPRQEFTPQVEDKESKENYSKTIVVKSGDTLSRILNDRGVSKNDLPAILDHELVQRHLTNLKIDQKLDFTFRWNGDLDNMSVKVNRDSRVVLRTTDKGYKLEKIHLPLEYERVVTSGTIQQSLYLAAEKANLKQSTIMTLADIFQWELDFAQDIRKGDNFSIVYDRLYRDGRYIGDGEILAAEFVRGDRIHRAIRFTDDENQTGYYSPDGQSKRRSFMRHPVDVVRITSKFDPNRIHPVLHKIRAHKGVDYGAPHGSPIKAVADGKIEFAGSKNAYGKTVIIKHDKTRTTLYAHMSEIDSNSKVGRKIRQGDVIGYVGRTGRVTGTHLHYELRIDGIHVDPLKVKFPHAEPLDPKYRRKLEAVSNELLTQMRSVTAIANDKVAVAD